LWNDPVMQVFPWREDTPLIRSDFRCTETTKILLKLSPQERPLLLKGHIFIAKEGHLITGRLQ
jgi:hypothetical protein